MLSTIVKTITTLKQVEKHLKDCCEQMPHCKELHHVTACVMRGIEAGKIQRENRKIKRMVRKHYFDRPCEGCQHFDILMEYPQEYARLCWNCKRSKVRQIEFERRRSERTIS